MITTADTAGSPSAALLRRARAGDEHAREDVVRRLMPMAQRVARRFATSQHPAEDLAQVAGIGVLKALERYDTTREASFTTYAHALMTGEVRRHIRDSRMVRIPRSIYEQVPAFQRALTRLRDQLGREPSRYQLAAELEVTKEEIIEIMDAAIHTTHVSLDAAAEESDGGFELGHHDAEFARAEAGVDLAPMLSVLTPRERTIIDMRFEDGLSQSEIATSLELSQTQVSRVIRQALEKLSRRAGIVV